MITHPGLLRRFTSPAAFAYAQLRAGNLPPTTCELEDWQSPQRQSLCDADRHYAPVEVDEEAHERRVAHARSIAPSDASNLTIALIAAALAEGASDEAAVASALLAAAQQPQFSEEVARAYRAHATR